MAKVSVKESRFGIGGITEVLWLVSCKHYAHSGKAVGVDDEVNISDRLSQHNCQGFIGFYSTISSSGLSNKLRGLSSNKNKEVQIFHRGVIETKIFKRNPGLTIAKRYFPESMKMWNDLNISKEESKAKMRQDFYEEYLSRKRKN